MPMMRMHEYLVRPKRTRGGATYSHPVGLADVLPLQLAVRTSSAAAGKRTVEEIVKRLEIKGDIVIKHIGPTHDLAAHASVDKRF